MPQLNATISPGLWQALLDSAERTKEPLAHIVSKALAEYLQVSHHTLYQVSTATALVEAYVSHVPLSQNIWPDGPVRLRTRGVPSLGITPARSLEDFTEFERRTVYFDGDQVTAAKKGVHLPDRASQVAMMAQMQNMLDFPLAPKLTALGTLNPAQATEEERLGQDIFFRKGPGWQAPYLLGILQRQDGDLAAPGVTLTLVLWALAGGALVLFPSLIHLFRILKRQPEEGPSRHSSRTDESRRISQRISWVHCDADACRLFSSPASRAFVPTASRRLHR